jgi:hypothetical protein
VNKICISPGTYLEGQKKPRTLLSHGNTTWKCFWNILQTMDLQQVLTNWVIKTILGMVKCTMDKADQCISLLNDRNNVRKSTAYLCYWCNTQQTMCQRQQMCEQEQF